MFMQVSMSNSSAGLQPSIAGALQSQKQLAVGQLQGSKGRKDLPGVTEVRLCTLMMSDDLSLIAFVLP